MGSAKDPLVEHARRTIRRALFGREASTSGDNVARIGRFELIEKLGEGGMGVVYSARDPSLDRRVAIKLLRPSHAAAHGGEERLQREAHALAKLSHPNVVVVHEVGLHEGQVYLVMEFVDGRTLGDWCLDHRDQWRAVVAKYCDAGRGLAAAHDAGFVHRDFKPDNVLVGREGRVRVLDFGLAAPGSAGDLLFESMETRELPAGDLTATGTVLGTPAYMAPEQYDANGVDARADQFAFCVSLWEGLFGQRPFGGTDLPSLRTALRVDGRRAPPKGAKVPRAVVGVLEQGLSIDPAGRFSGMPALLAELDAAMEQPQARPRAAILAIAATVAMAAGVGVWVQQRTGSATHDSTPDADRAAVGGEAGTFESSLLDPDAAPVRVPIRRLTQTSGRGVDAVDIDHDGGRLLYLHDGFWLRAIDGGVPKKPLLPIEHYDNLLLAKGGGFIVLHDQRVSRVDASGDVKDVALALPDDATGWQMSMDGRHLWAVTPSAVLIWDLDAPGPPSHIDVDSSRMQSMTWAPDGTAIALTTFEMGSSAELRVLDRTGTMVAATRLASPWSSVGWLETGALVVLESDDDAFWLRCYHLRERELIRGRRSSSLGVASRFHHIVRSDAGGKVLLRLTDVQNDVAVIEPGDPPKVTWLSRGWDGDDHDPVWLADGGLAIGTGRFLQRTLVRVGEDLVSAVPIVEDPIAWVEGDGAGGLLYATDAEPSALRWIAAGAREAADVSGPGLETGAAEAQVACIRPSDCLMTRPSDEGPIFFALDLTTGRTQRRFACPQSWRCSGRRRWTYARDAKRVLMIDEAQRRLAEFDSKTGERLRIHPEPPEQWIIQSVREAADGSGYWLTGMDLRAGAGDLYTLYRYRPGGDFRVVWRAASTWVFGPEPAHDDTRVAVDALTLHGDAWLADAGELCGDGP